MRQMRISHLVAAAMVVAVVAAGCARVDPGRAQANGVWTQRLNAQAAAQEQQAARAELARDAWIARMEGLVQAYRDDQAAKQRADDAYSQRLNGLAGMSDRAIQAWIDRLNGLAEDEGATD